jgi:aminoglycoside phosphotransferase (APT) family kinase protein
MSSVDAVEASARLSAAGFEVAIAELRPDPREERTMFAMPGARAAWFAGSDAGRVRLRHEARVLRLLAQRCSFEVPRVLFESADAALQVRALVPGNPTPFEWYRVAQSSPEKAREFGSSIGAILAEQHRRIQEVDVAGWSRRALLWPLPRPQVREALGRVVSDRVLGARCDRVLAMKEEVQVVPSDCALVHGDLGFHNAVLDPDTLRVIGVYDYDGAGWVDRHYDFRYLVFDESDGALDQVLEGALAVYEPLVGVALSRARIRLYNAASAVGFLASRDGHAPDENWCGRTLSEDLAWTEYALSRVGV